MLSAPGNIPKSWCSPPCLPHGMQPLPGTLCHGSHAPSSHPRQHWGVHQQLLMPNPVPCPTSHPQACEPPLFPLLQLSHHIFRPSIGSAPWAPRAAAAPALAAPQDPAASARAGAVPGPAPSYAPTQPPGGLQACRENKILSSTLEFTQLTQKCGRGAPHEHGLPELSRRASRKPGGAASC